MGRIETDRLPNEAVIAEEGAAGAVPDPVPTRTQGDQRRPIRRTILKTRLIPTVALTLALAAPALAQTAPTRDSAQIQAGTYAVDASHTQVGWTVSHMGFSNYHGGFSDVSGSLTLDPKNPAQSKLSIKIPVASVSTTSDKLTGELKGEQWLDGAKFPEMTFVSTKVEPQGKDKAKILGNLTLHGVTKPVTLDVTLVGAGANPMSKKYTVGFDATGTIKRSEFGVKTYVPLIGDDLHLTIAGAFERRD
jgi:polyisoprenoid-binding protein YceI